MDKCYVYVHLTNMYSIFLGFSGHIKDATYIASLWRNAINEIGAEYVSAIVTDGASVNKAAAVIINQE